MANVAVNNLVTKACLDAEIAALNLGTTEVGDGTTVVGAGTPADPFKAGDLVANADGSYTYTKADGSTIVIPADCCPTLVRNADGSHTYTHGDGSTVTIPAPAVGGVPEVGDGVTVVGAGTPADPFVAGDLVANADGSYTYTKADSTQIVIPAGGGTDDQNAAEVPIVGVANGLLSGAVTVEDALQQIDDWTKTVINVGASLPIADVADAGAKPLLTSGQLQFAETDDIITTIGSDGVVRNYTRFVGSVYRGVNTDPYPRDSLVHLQPPNVEFIENITYANGTFTIIVPGYYKIAAMVAWEKSNVWDAATTAITTAQYLRLHKNGILYSSMQRQLVPDGENEVVMMQGEAHHVYLNTGDTIEVHVYNQSNINMAAYTRNHSNWIDISRTH